MKYKLILVGILTGVLSSCVKYRIKEVTHSDGGSYYFPQKRKMVLSEWKDISPSGNYTYDWARGVIIEDKSVFDKRTQYLKFTN